MARRLDVQTASQFALLQMALSTQPNMNVKPSATKRAVTAFQKMLKDMLGNGK